MTFYGTFEATSSETPMIDFLDFEFKRIPDHFVPEDIRTSDGNKGVILSIDWDESDWKFVPETREGIFRAKGVYINNVYANGHAEAFKSAALDAIQVHGADNFVLTDLELTDGEDYFRFSSSSLDAREVVYE